MVRNGIQNERQGHGTAVGDNAATVRKTMAATILERREYNPPWEASGRAGE